MSDLPRRPVIRAAGPPPGLVGLVSILVPCLIASTASGEALTTEVHIEEFRGLLSSPLFSDSDAANPPVHFEPSISVGQLPTTGSERSGPLADTGGGSFDVDVLAEASAQTVRARAVLEFVGTHSGGEEIFYSAQARGVSHTAIRATEPGGQSGSLVDAEVRMVLTGSIELPEPDFLVSGGFADLFAIARALDPGDAPELFEPGAFGATVAGTGFDATIDFPDTSYEVNGNSADLVVEDPLNPNRWTVATTVVQPVGLLLDEVAWVGAELRLTVGKTNFTGNEIWTGALLFDQTLSFQVLSSDPDVSIEILPTPEPAALACTLGVLLPLRGLARRVRRRSLPALPAPRQPRERRPG